MDSWVRKGNMRENEEEKVGKEKERSIGKYVNSRWRSDTVSRLIE